MRGSAQRQSASWRRYGTVEDVMELVGILVIPLLASGFALLPLGRRFAAPVTLLATAIVLGLSLAVAAEAARTGHVAASGEWLTCDGLGALVLLLVAFVGFTA